MHALEIESLVKTYPNGVEALKGINLKVEEGDFFALLGPNGAGKSTAIGVVASLVNKTQGAVKIFGYDLDKETSLAKSKIGLVPQEFNFNIFEKVIDIVVNQAGFYGIPRDKAYARAEYYLKKLQLWDKKDSVSRTLSGGMKRRLMIARGMVHDPKLLVLDEPTAGVDIEIRRSMWTFMQEMNAQGVTIILTTHYLEEAEQLCRNIAIIDQGNIIEHTTKKALLSKLMKETLILDLANPISEFPQLDGYDARLIDSSTVEISYHRDESLNQLFNLLSAKKIEVASLRNKSNRLEELFMDLTKKESGDLVA